MPAKKKNSFFAGIFKFCSWVFGCLDFWGLESGLYNGRLLGGFLLLDISDQSFSLFLVTGANQYSFYGNQCRFLQFHPRHYSESPPTGIPNGERFSSGNLLAIGQAIIEEEQDGKLKADYGKSTLKLLAEKLTTEFGKGFEERNLNNMRAFYRAFPIWNALRTELSWTHYRLLSRLDTEEKRAYYLNEAIAGNWNSRELQRQISLFAFERVLEHPPAADAPLSIQNILKDPYIFEFLGLPADTKSTEREIETAILDHLQQFLLELGKGFAFVARQQHMVTDTSDFFIRPRFL